MTSEEPWSDPCSPRVPVDPLVSRCRLEVRSQILGDSVFWEGTNSELGQIRSEPGRAVVAAVFRTGRPQKWGMWYGFLCG